MIDDRFSSNVFLEQSLDVEALKALTKLLASEIQQELHEVANHKFKEVVDELNQNGHNLKEYGEQQPFDFSYRDDWEDESGYHCKLRVGFYGIVSIGYVNFEA